MHSMLHFVVIKKMASFEKTAEIIAQCMQLSPREGKKTLKKALEKNDGRIEGLTIDIATIMVDRLKEIGTIAVIDEIFPFC